MTMTTTITINKSGATIKTDVITGKKLLMKNGLCESTVRNGQVILTYPASELMTITSILKSV
jgi:hypothetical protein